MTEVSTSDFAVVVYREDETWDAEVLPASFAENLDSLIRALKQQPSLGGTIGLAAVGDDFFVALRVVGGQVSVFLSDLTASVDWPLARQVLKYLDIPVPDDEDLDQVLPVGDLSIFADQSFDFILATDNVIDALSHEDRLRALKESHRVLRPNGLLAFSAHNIHYKKAFLGPQLHWSPNPIRFAANCAGYLLSQWNHHRVAPLRTSTSEYALINDPGHRYACLHYYAARSTVRSQLASVGLQWIEAFDRTGQIVGETQDDSDTPSLFYVAERVRAELA